MITLHGKCQGCGRLEASIEVHLPHATNEHKKRAGVSTSALLATAICKECVQSMVAAWARHGAAEWAQTRAEWLAAHETDPAEAP